MIYLEELQILQEHEQAVAEEHLDDALILQPPSGILETDTEVVVMPIDQGIRVIIPESTDG